MGNNKKDDKEIPTITSLLKRKKLRAGANALDRSKPMDLSELEREFAPVGDNNPPSIDGFDWDTRGIARQDKHNEAAKKSDEFKTMLEKNNARPGKTTERTRKRSERSISVSVKINKHQQPVIVRESEARALARSQPVPQQRSHPAALLPVQTARERGVSNARPIATWTMEMLKGGPDPLGKGLSILLEKGATTALFLSIAPPPPGAKIPHFVSAAAAKPTREKLAIWQGLRWDPATVPQVWNQLLKSGYVEFHPPGNVTNIGSRRNMIRGAFGLGSEEILVLIRIGPVAACRGVLAIYSDRSLLIELGPILTLFNTPLPIQKTG